MGVDNVVGNRLREIRGRDTQEKFVKKLGTFSVVSRSSYSMVEIGKRQASYQLLNAVSEKEKVSYDYMFGLVDSRVDIQDPRYHQLLEIWCNTGEKEKNSILNYAKRIAKKGEV